jgi:type IV pilus assembly protein PilO
MTNLQRAREQRDAGLSAAVLRRLWFWSPIVAGALMAAVVLASFAVPRWLEIGTDQERLRELEQKQQEALLLQVQTKKALEDRRKAEQQRQTLFQLVSGSGDPATFLATLDLEARRTGVRLQLYEPTTPAPPPPVTPGAPPVAAGAPPPKVGPDGKPLPPPPPEPIEQAGLLRREVLLSARGTYSQLLAFLRRLELLDVLVEQRNLALAVSGDLADGTPVNKQELEPPVPEVEVKLSLAFYEGKEKKDDSKRKTKAKGVLPEKKPPPGSTPVKAP